MSTTVSKSPRFGVEDAVRFSRELYALEASARPLPSERDQNFLLETSLGSFVLKIAGAAERPEVLDLQNEALEWLAERAPSLPLPRLCRASAGARVARVEARDGSERLVRMLSYLPGTILAQAKPQSPGLLRALGRFLGELDAALEGFSHPAAVGRELVWNPALSLAVIARHLDAISDPSRRSLVEHFVAEFEGVVSPLLPRLRRSVIHNDANDYNVLVGDPVPGDRRVAGLLDFGDMLEGWTVCEPAVAMAYAIFGAPDPLAAGASLVNGYHEAHPLIEAEIEALWTLSAIRLCTSVCLSARRRTHEPDNEYLVVSESPAWEALARMRAVHPRLAHYTFRKACGLPPCRATPMIQEWLRAHRTEAGAVVHGNLESAVIFDLSVGSPEFETIEQATDTRAMTQRLFTRMRAAGADVGIGRYDEARLLYTSEAFEGPAGEHPERRTVHLAIDIFMEVGSPVLAPLAGRVHSFRDNAQRIDYGPTIVLEHEPAGAPRFFTLYGHLSQESLEGLSEGMAVAKGQLLGKIGSPPANGDWPPHVHFQIITDMLDRRGEFPGVAAASERDVWLALCPDPNLILGIPQSRLANDAVDVATLREARRRLLGPSLSLSYRAPLEIVRGARQFLYDPTGRAYLDMVNNVAHVGHCHPRVVGAGRRQMAVLNTNTRYLHDAIVRYAERLTATLPEPLRVCFFVCSGSEANELALRMARAHTKGRDVIVVDGAYHGNTQATIDISPYKFDGPGGEGPPPHVHKVPMPDDYRGLYRREDPERGEKFALHIREAAEASRERGGKPSAFMCESLLSCGGQIEPPPGYLAAAYRHAREAGAVCIADEVQVGFGRVGTHFWGFQTQDVTPDIVTMGKPIGNGHPLAAVVTTPEIAASFANGMEYFNTFGGNPVSCEIGLAVLDVIRDEALQVRALEVGGHLSAGLARLMDRHAIIGDVRGRGLFLGIELVLDRQVRSPAAAQAAYVVERMKDHRILLSTDGPDHNVIKMKPPLCFSKADADRVVAAYDSVLDEDFVRWR
ncbi:MAG TPA: aminotransferase class III-fold pyridoxal phosphate-dependent enzyme [Thermoanaerobaculia bacterium]|jgi:4-aminobutyrate aminotransferase-like enzyme/Ser/Thr protein kinase RdoA (MazF antagonist)